MNIFHISSMSVHSEGEVWSGRILIFVWIPHLSCAGKIKDKCVDPPRKDQEQRSVNNEKN